MSIKKVNIRVTDTGIQFYNPNDKKWYKDSSFVNIVDDNIAVTKSNNISFVDLNNTHQEYNIDTLITLPESSL